MSKKILIVEDEEQLLNVLSVKLSKEGYEILKATDGFMGLEVALNRKPDLIILDILMPRMSGLGTLKSLRENPWGKEAKVIVLTNVPSEDETALKAIADYNPAYYFQKTSITLETLSARIKDLLL